ncbi:hypothetical protein PoB_006818000 [Plakobranchus ocellatus]|uniref:WW domain-containing protein n=1 Tax=Plakobranchus ocellatus TaxID=259542 RepID=A0AAV4DC94_9GAST|nr:hypothetical protein PoB_006818000 [Plakobranchus ocellatus]
MNSSAFEKERKITTKGFYYFYCEDVISDGGRRMPSPIQSLSLNPANSAETPPVPPLVVESWLKPLKRPGRWFTARYTRTSFRYRDPVDDAWETNVLPEPAL